MKQIRVSDIAAVLGYTPRMIREHIEAGELKAVQNPKMIRDGKRSTYKVPDYAIEEWLERTLEMPPAIVQEVLRKLGVNFKQMLLPLEVAA